MKKLFVTLSFFLVSSIIYLPQAKAQSPCGGVGIGIGPFGIGVVLDCPPPPPTIVVVRPRVRRPVPRPVYAPPPAPIVRRRVAQVPPPPVSISNKLPMPQFTVGTMFDSASYSDGGMAGSGAYVRMLLGRAFALEASVSVLSSCTSCNPEAQRLDSNFGVAALYYLDKVQPIGFNFYLKAGLLWKHVEFSNLNTYESSSVEQSGVEVGGGMEWRLNHWLSFNAEMTAMGVNSSESDFDHGNINEHLAKGIPSANNDNASLNFRLGVALHF